jgi:hypothetical protein
MSTDPVAIAMAHPDAMALAHPVLIELDDLVGFLKQTRALRRHRKHIGHRADLDHPLKVWCDCGELILVTAATSDADREDGRPQ